MLVAPARRCRLIARLRREAMTCGACPVRTWERSSAKVTSRTQCRPLSGSPSALLRWGPFRTGYVDLYINGCMSSRWLC